MNLMLPLAVLIILIVFSAFFSAAEVSIVASSDEKIYRMSKEGKKEIKLLQKLLESKDRTTSAILLGNNIANIMASSVGAVISILLLDRYAFGKVATILLNTVMMTAIITLFGEILPKSYVIKGRQETTALRLAKPLWFMTLCLRPIVIAIDIIKRPIEQLFGIGGEEEQENRLSAHEELKDAVEYKHHQGRIVKGDKEMFSGLLKLREVEICQVMQHRGDIFAVDIETNTKELIDKILSSQYSRIPVYRGSIDKILGILHVRDLFALLHGENNKLDRRVESCLEKFALLHGENNKLDRRVESCLEKTYKSGDDPEEAFIDFQNYIKTVKQLVIDNTKETNTADTDIIVQHLTVLSETIKIAINTNLKSEQKTLFETAIKLINNTQISDEYIGIIKEKISVIVKTASKKANNCKNSLTETMDQLKKCIVDAMQIQSIKIEQVLKKPMIVPESATLYMQLMKFKSGRNHLAIVVDEHGNTSGLLTLEDVIEEVVGDITDEHDIENDDIIEYENGVIIVKGDCLVIDFCRKFDLDLEHYGSVTISGLVIDEIKRIPTTGEKLTSFGYEVIIKEATESTIKQLQMTKIKALQR